MLIILTSSFKSNLSLLLSSYFTGYQKQFANKIYVVESHWGNCKGNYQGGGDSPDLSSVGSESVLGDNINSSKKHNNGRETS
jgi:hypothetical protein